jgi:hypothetical protein
MLYNIFSALFDKKVMIQRIYLRILPSELFFPKNKQGG